MSVTEVPWTCVLHTTPQTVSPSSGRRSWVARAGMVRTAEDPSAGTRAVITRKTRNHTAKPWNYVPGTITNMSVSDITFHFPCCSPVARNRSVDSLPGGRPLAARIRSIAAF